MIQMKRRRRRRRRKVSRRATIAGAGSMLVALVVTLFVFEAVSSAETAPELEQCAGRWQGRGDVIVLWCKLDSLDVDVTFDAFGNVHGTIGDARLTDATVGRRNWIMRRLGNGDYLVRAKLDGDLVASEGIHRESIAFMFTIDGRRLWGAITSAGWRFGGSKRMPMTVADVDCRRVEPSTAALH